MAEGPDILQRKMNYLVQSNQELKRRLFDLNTVFEISRSLNSILDVDTLLENVLDACVAQLEIDGAAIVIQRRNGKEHLSLIKTKNLETNEKLDLRFDCEGELVRLLKSSGKHMSKNQIAKHLDFSSSDFKKLEALGCQICVPLICKNQMRGVLFLSKKIEGKEFEEKDLEFITMLTEQMAAAIENAVLYESERKSLEQLKNAQRQLIRSEKLVAIGQLSASLAHEINNPLGIIKNYLALTQNSLSPQDKNRANLGIIEEELDRIARIVRQLLDLCQPRNEKMLPADLPAIVEQTISLVEKQFEKNKISIVRQFHENLPTLEGYSDQLKQLFLNLLMNAQDSMPQGGKIHIAVSKNEDQIRICFSDTGCGIPKENISRVFEPFFTTKADKKGTGLGLWICLEIINQHNGTISLENRSEGTGFIINLPIKQR
ncbi:MAG TPA: ATP-binding protein [candidate division Zixibacteria bacterium]